MKERTYTNGLVSVVIPLYNSAGFITPTLESVLCQTYHNIEVILVDDCSKDSTREVVMTFADKDSRIKYFLQDKNQGAAVARNRGLEEANGQYIALLDSDDLWTPDKLEKQLDFMKAKNAAFVFCAYDYVDGSGRTIQGKVNIKERVEYNDLMTKTYISTSTVLLDRNKIGEKRMPLRRTGQDYAYWLLLLRETDAYGIDEAMVHYRIHKGSLSKNKFQSIKDIWETQTQLENIPKLSVAIHVLQYIFFTLKKRYF